MFMLIDGVFIKFVYFIVEDKQINIYLRINDFDKVFFVIFRDGRKFCKMLFVIVVCKFSWKYK